MPHRLTLNSWKRMLAVSSSCEAMREPKTSRRQRFPRKMACQEIDTRQQAGSREHAADNGRHHPGLISRKCGKDEHLTGTLNWAMICR